MSSVTNETNTGEKKTVMDVSAENESSDDNYSSTKRDSSCGQSQGDIDATIIKGKGNEANSNLSPQSLLPHFPSGTQQHPAYYYQHATQSPNSSNIPTLGSIGYDVQALMFQQQAVAGNNHYSGQPYSTNIPHSPVSPIQSSGNEGLGGNAPTFPIGLIPPASPLFPTSNTESMDASRMNNISALAPSSPSVQYLSGPPSTSGFPGYGEIYQGYVSGSPSNLSYRRTVPRDHNLSDQRSWSERPSIPQQPVYPTTTPAPSPLMQSQGMSLQYQGGAGQSRRTNSFDEILPPPAMDNNGALFQPQWAYNSTTDPYNATVSPHASPQVSPVHRQALGHQRNMQHQNNDSSFHPYYNATTPGPPIQTSSNNKGPDGANLFVFHIPNHFTNVDMWHLFCHYGNLLSVRIMVEKDTGRSRGFGFVSFDSPDAAAMAIKELNGFVIGNKRLKVQHKQIRQSDHSNSHRSNYPPDLPSIPDTDTIGGGATWFGGHESIEVSCETSSSNTGTNVQSHAPQAQSPYEAVQNKHEHNIKEDKEKEEVLGDNESASPLSNLDRIRDSLPQVKKK
mmetsp:Transcript_8210/g.11731  ORF Transcript_8210/g.11731 Transcript_8210/m.11731 type:complete len:563 (-) Transcript_8210:367-2055(-)|eukprot:CAMPEP_0184863576 /NCGR_PEP_ID=MMETSP0580-20130426/11689_1 /TAXON_ID=1118495 /ORGANISM="Dactyliosolen fragilissimus" /LENGTH=562 /DNA_ID=CAMNT_0027361991 /DNA_START=73 /DNA_END=1761 /DNA_ORIENTATION=-